MTLDLEGADRRQLAERNATVRLAWQIEAMRRADPRRPLPKLSSLLEKPKRRGPAPPQSMDEQIAMARMITRTFEAKAARERALAAREAASPTED